METPIRGLLTKQIASGALEAGITLQVTSALTKGDNKWKIELTDGEGSIVGIVKTSIVLEDRQVLKISKAMLNTMNGAKVAVITQFEVLGQMETLLRQAGAASGPPKMQQSTPSTAEKKVMSASMSTPAGVSGGKPYASSPYNAPMEHGSPSSVASQVDATGAPLKRAPPNCMPFKGLNPYRNNWTIKGRVTTMSEMKTYNNARGPGKVFSADILDCDGDEVRVSFFGDAADKFYNVIKPQCVYTFANGMCKPCTKYSKINANTVYEITLNQYSQVEQVAEDDDIKAAVYNFSKISELVSAEVNSSVDILAVVKAASEVSQINTKKGTQLSKRELTAVDESGADVRVTLWGKRAEEPVAWHEQPIIACKGLRVGEYNNGKTLAAGGGCLVAVNPVDVPAAYELHKWRVAEMESKGRLSSSSLSASGGGSTGDREAEPLLQRTYLSDLKQLADNIHSVPEKGVYNTFMGTITKINDGKPFYEACPECSKKVMQDSSGEWQCEKCQKGFDQCMRRYILSMKVEDSTGQSWCSTFNDQGQQLVGLSADDLCLIGAEEGEEKLKARLNQATFDTFIFKVRSRREVVKDEPRLKTTILQVWRPDWTSECSQLVEAIGRYE